MKTISLLLLVVLSFSLFSCKRNNVSADDEVTIVKANGNIQDDVDAFKNILGPSNLTPNAVGGHREINWEGVPDSMLDKQLPGNFFNPAGNGAADARQRGILYSSGTFVVSSTGFDGINNQASSQFSAFSGTKTFANTTAARWDITFQKTATTQSAFVQAFGVVLVDVDKENSISLEFFEGEKSLGKYFVPPHDATSNFSFLGARFTNDQRVTRVTVTHDGFLTEGTKDISDGGLRDLIVLDDFIYSEPVAIR